MCVHVKEGRNKGYFRLTRSWLTQWDAPIKAEGKRGQLWWGTKTSQAEYKLRPQMIAGNESDAPTEPYDSCGSDDNWGYNIHIEITKARAIVYFLGSVTADTRCSRALIEIVKFKFKYIFAFHSVAIYSPPNISFRPFPNSKFEFEFIWILNLNLNSNGTSVQYLKAIWRFCGGLAGG